MFTPLSHKYSHLLVLPLPETTTPTNPILLQTEYSNLYLTSVAFFRQLVPKFSICQLWQYNRVYFHYYSSSLVKKPTIFFSSTAILYFCTCSSFTFHFVFCNEEERFLPASSDNIKALCLCLSIFIVFLSKYQLYFKNSSWTIW